MENKEVLTTGPIQMESVVRVAYGHGKPNVHRLNTQDTDYEGGGAHQYCFNKMFKNEETGKMDFTESVTPIIRFVQTLSDGTTIEGITDEQLMICLIDRMTRLNKRFPSREGAIAITKLQEALHWREEKQEKEKIVEY
jgi:hypothetical protein